MGAALRRAGRVELLYSWPAGPTGHPRAGLSRAGSTPAVLSEVKGGVCCACARAHLPLHRCRILRCEGDGCSVPLPPTLRGLSSQHHGKLTLLHVKTLSIFMRLETAGAGGGGFKSSTGWDTRRCSVPPPRRDNKTRTSGSTEGPVPGSCPRTRTPAPTRKHEQAEQISGLNFRPYPEISGFCHVNLYIYNQNAATEFGGAGRQRECPELSDECERCP